MHFMLVPPEIKQVIFSYLEPATLLSSIQIVCKAFQRNVNDVIFWSKFTSLTFEEEKLKERFTTEAIHEIIKVIRKCPDIRKLKITSPNCFSIDANFFRCLCELRELDTLVLRGFFIDVACEGSFACFITTSPPQLKCLDLYMSTVESIQCLWLLPTIKTLKKFVAPETQMDTYLIYEYMLANCKELEYLDISYQLCVDDNWNIPFRLDLRADKLKTLIIMDNPRQPLFYSSISECTKLSNLKIDCSDLISLDALNIKDLELKELFLKNALYTLDDVPGNIRSFRDLLSQANITNLTHAGFHSCTLDDNCLQILATRCPHLISLSMHRLDDVTDAGLRNILNCSKITNLTLKLLDKIEGSFLIKIKNSLPLLTILVLSKTHRLKIRNLKAFLEINPDFEIKVYERMFANGFETEPVVSPNFQPTLFTDRKIIDELDAVKYSAPRKFSGAGKNIRRWYW